MRHALSLGKWTAALSAVLMLAGCGPSTPIDQALAVEEIATGYHDGGTIDGQHRLLPILAFQIRNVSQDTIASVQFNAVFRVAGEEEELGSQLIRGITGDGLAPGATTERFVLRSGFGYSGEQARGEMFQHQGFQDVQVQLFAKAGGAQWVQLADQIVARQLLTIGQ